MFTVCAARAIGNSRELCLDSRIHCVQCNDVHVCVCTNPVSKCTCKHMHACMLSSAFLSSINHAFLCSPPFATSNSPLLL